jgi:autotransporter-associated beta strand protein
MFVVEPEGSALEDGAVVFTAEKGISIPDGVAVKDVAAITIGVDALKLSSDGKHLILDRMKVPVIATWVGLGDRANIFDPHNWQCKNESDTILDGAVPTEETTIKISGETSFNYPINQASQLRYKSFELGPGLKLTADCDWRGFGTKTPYAASTTIDLDGHKFYTEDITSSVVVMDSSSAEPGECHLDFDNKVTVTGLNLKGNVRLVKEGSAELVLNYAVNPTYTGGTEIREGRIGSTLDATKRTQFGLSGSEIIVRSGATLYPYYHDNWLTLYPIVLDGGSIYTWWAGQSGLVIGSMRLLADSSLDVYSGGRLHIWTGHTVNLNGHTLALIGVGDKCFSASGSTGVTFTEGVVDLQAGTMSLAGAVHAVNTTFLIGGALNLGGNTLNVSNYIARYTGTSNAGTGAMNVYGTFKPIGAGYYAPTMKNGSTIDFTEWKKDSALESRFPVTATSNGNKIMKFEAGTVKIRISSDNKELRSFARTLPNILTWTNECADRNEETDFVLEDANGNPLKYYALIADDSGLKLKYLGGMAIFIR